MLQAQGRHASSDSTSSAVCILRRLSQARWYKLIAGLPAMSLPSARILVTPAFFLLLNTCAQSITDVLKIKQNVMLNT
jgi:hypothetical protein